MFEDGLDQAVEQCFFAGDAGLFGVQDLALALFQHICGVALGIFHRLLTHIVVRDEGDVAFGDFDEVTKGAVEADAQVFDAGALLLS